MYALTLIGLMSGTSMDGLDVAQVRVQTDDNQNDTYQLIHAGTYPFPDALKNKLLNATEMNIPQLCQTDKELGLFYADSVNDFIQKNKIDKSKIDAIASHGQTIFHQPQHGFTLQIGCGTTLAYHTGIPVINDFRTKDVVAGGQGAPLVPIGDFGLFSRDSEAFLNIGGFVNISFRDNNTIRAFDICPGNLPLNKLVSSKGLDYDPDGSIASSGEINFFLLDLLNSLPYYEENPPKSLGTEWLESEFYPQLKFDKEIENNLRTVVEHEAIQISKILNAQQINRVMITGGGARNKFLIERIAHYYAGEIQIPDPEIVEYKEAIIFAYLGALYLQKRPNTLHSVTGAQKDTIGGVLHIPE